MVVSHFSLYLNFNVGSENIVWAVCVDGSLIDHRDPSSRDRHPEDYRWEDPASEHRWA